MRRWICFALRFSSFDLRLSLCVFSFVAFRFCVCPILFTLTKKGSDVCEGWGFSLSLLP